MIEDQSLALSEEIALIESLSPREHELAEAIAIAARKITDISGKKVRFAMPFLYLTRIGQQLESALAELGFKLVKNER